MDASGEATPARVRVVLAEVARRPGQDRTRAELAEQTRVGEALVRGLVRAQLALALRLALVVAVGLGALPLLFAAAPDTAEAKLFGIHLPWLLLGVAAYPLLLVVGGTYVWLAERNEQDFTALVERPEPLAERPEPLAERPEALAERPEPLVERPEPLIDQPDR